MKKRSCVSAVGIAISLAAFALASAPAAQAAYPEDNRVVEWVCHGSPGNAADMFMRSSADILNKKGIVKAKIMVQNRPGGASAVAINYLNTRAGDPYVMMQGGASQFMTMLRGTTTMKIQDPTWLSTLIEDPLILIVPNSSPYKTLADLLADAKAHPKKVSVGILNIGGNEHRVITRIERAMGIKFNITSFEFTQTMLIGGHIDVTFGNVAETSGHVKSKRARALASVGTNRVPYYKNVPTLKEQGVNVAISQYRGFFAGPNFPDEAIRFWDDAFAKLMKTKEFAGYMAKSDTIPAFKTAAESKLFLADYIKGLDEDLKYIAANK